MRTTLVSAALCCLIGLVQMPALAQKTQKGEKARSAAAAPQQVTMKDLLMRHEGKTTNLGKLTRVTSEYFVLEQEGTVSTHPLSVLHTIRLVKDEETGEQSIELVLLAGD